MQIQNKFMLLVAATCLVFSLQCSNNPASAQSAKLSDMQNRIQSISSVVSSLRGLNFIRPVHAGLITRAQYAKNTAQDINSGLTSIEQNALSKEYAQMGCLAETDTPIGQILTNYYTGFPAAYYVTGTDSLYVLTDETNNDTDLNVYISHELTHALQDQNLGMDFSVLPSYSLYNSDAYLGHTSLLEGDATFTEYNYLVDVYYQESNPYVVTSPISLKVKSYFLSANDSTIQRPFFLEVKGAYPYDVGWAYIADLFYESQWSAVNARYSIATIPKSSAEINREAPFTPLYFDFHSIQSLLAAQSGGIVFSDDDNGGFALMLGLFYGQLDTQRVNRSLDWSGDRYTFVMRTGQSYGTLVWAMAFSTTDAANYMFSNFDKLIRSRMLGGKSPYYSSVDSATDSVSQGMAYTYSSSVFTTRLIRTANQIWWLDHTDSLTQPIIAALAQQQPTLALAKLSAVLPIHPTLLASRKHSVDSQLKPLISLL
jgi:hypothetical protein